eukprot:352453-Chlamydomonas_euryale.AAC.3
MFCHMPAAFLQVPSWDKLRASNSEWPNGQPLAASQSIPSGSYQHGGAWQGARKAVLRRRQGTKAGPADPHPRGRRICWRGVLGVAHTRACML